MARLGKHSPIDAYPRHPLVAQAIAGPCNRVGRKAVARRERSALSRGPTAFGKRLLALARCCRTVTPSKLSGPIEGTISRRRATCVISWGRSPAALLDTLSASASLRDA